MSNRHHHHDDRLVRRGEAIMKRSANEKAALEAVSLPERIRGIRAEYKIRIAGNLEDEAIIQAATEAVRHFEQTNGEILLGWCREAVVACKALLNGGVS